MQNLIAHFKERPRTAAVLLGVAVLIAAAVWMHGGRPRPAGMRTVSLGLVGQNGSDAYYGYEESGGSVASKAYPVPMPGSPMMYEQDRMMMPPFSPTAGETAADVDQKIIKTGSLDVLVENVTEAAARASKIATERGGFVQSSSVSERGDGTYNGSIVVRVPVEKFEATMADMRGLATLVRNESSDGQDVTEQYTDLEAQLRNAKAQEETYLEVLKQARSVEDILKVQERLGSIRATIESLQGRIQYLTNATSYSTISLSLSEESAVRAPTKEFRPLRIITAAFQTLVIVIQNVIAGIIWLVIVWGGILLPLGLIAWLIVRAWKRRRGSMNP